MCRAVWLLALIPTVALSQSELTDCAEQFIGGDPANVPTVLSSTPDQPFGGNIHLCSETTA